jgi:serine/threonine protein kinase
MFKTLPQKNINEYGYPDINNGNKLLGKGSFGEVYASEDKYGNKYAIKIIKSLNSIVLDEINSMLSLPDNKYIMKPIDICMNIDNMNDKNVYIVLPRGDFDLHEYIKKGIPKDKYIKYIYQMCTAVATCIQHDIWNRDIKPDNFIYFENEDKLVISDFGLSIFNGCNNPKKKYSRGFTMPYRAPENIINNNSYCIEGDIWSLGCTIYEMILGKHAFPYEDENSLFKEQLFRVGIPLSDTFEKYNSKITSMAPDVCKDIRTKISGIFDGLGEFQNLILNMLKIEPKNRIKYWQILDSCPLNSIHSEEDDIQKWSCCQAMLLKDKYIIFNELTSKIIPSTEINLNNFLMYKIYIFDNLYRLYTFYNKSLHIDISVYFLSNYIFDKFYTVSDINLENDKMRKILTLSCFYISLIHSDSDAAIKFINDFKNKESFLNENSHLIKYLNISIDEIVYQVKIILYRIQFFFNFSSSWDFLISDLNHLCDELYNHNPLCDLKQLRDNFEIYGKHFLHLISYTIIPYLFTPSIISRNIFTILIIINLPILNKLKLKSFIPCGSSRFIWTDKNTIKSTLPNLSNLEIILSQIQLLITKLKQSQSGLTYLDILYPNEILNIINDILSILSIPSTI